MELIKLLLLAAPKFKHTKPLEEFKSSTEFTWVICALGQPQVLEKALPKQFPPRRKHVAAQRVLDELAQEEKLTFKRLSVPNAECHIAEWGRLALVSCQTLMNDSGIAVKGLCYKLGIKPNQLIILHDDYKLALGKVELVNSDTPTSHKGVADIAEKMGVKGLVRLSIGIGLKPKTAHKVEFVMANFTPEEYDQLKTCLPEVKSTLLGLT
jgi:peptidyl-tRNA hydrolase